MLQREFIRALAFEAKISDAMSREIVQVFKRIVRREVEEGEKVTLTGLCEFRLRHLAARTCHHPHGGEPIDVPAMDVPACQVSDSWREECKARSREAAEEVAESLPTQSLGAESLGAE